MNIRVTADRLVRVCLVIGALFAFMGNARGADRPPPSDRALYADVKGIVVDDATGAPMPGVPVSLLYETVVTAEDGTFLFQKIPLIHTAQVSLRVSTEEGLVIGCTTLDVPVRFYPISASVDSLVDVKVMEPGAESSVELRVKKVQVSEVNRYCTGCHIKNPCVETETFSSVIKTGKDLRGIIVKESQLDKFKEQLRQQGVSKDSYAKIRYQDTHPDNMDMIEVQNSTGRLAGQFMVPQTLTLHEVQEPKRVRKFVVCDTCHSRHFPTLQKQYVLMPFGEDSQLCYQCHK